MRNLILSALLILTVGVSAAFAVPPCCQGLNAAAASTNDVWSQLTPDQQKQVDTIETAFQTKLQAFRSSLAAKRNELKAIMGNDKLDEPALEAKRQEMWALQDGLRKDYRQTLTEMSKILTPDQKRELGPLGLMGSRMLGSAVMGGGQRGCCGSNGGAQFRGGCCGAAGAGVGRGGCCGGASGGAGSTLPPCCRPGGGA